MKNKAYKAIFSIVAGAAFLFAAAPAFAQYQNWYPYYSSSYQPSYSYQNWYQSNWYDPYAYGDYSYGWNDYYQPSVQYDYCYYARDCYNYGTLSIANVSGPNSLIVGQQGTWTVRVSGSSSYLSYSVIWGDEQINPYMQSASAQQMSSSGTFTHTYRQAGTYSPRFTVTDSYGQSQSASATVTVSGGGTICGTTYSYPVGNSIYCPLPPPVSGNFSAIPTSGAAPLAVIFGIQGSFSFYTIDFGDGQTTNGAILDTDCSVAGRCTSTHTYASAGTYTAILYQGGKTSTQPVRTLGTVTITVSGGYGGGWYCGYYPWLCYGWQE